MMYLPVGDLAESLRRVGEEGGKIVKETMRADGAYTSAVIEDPVGVTLTLVQE
jgi:predicted enzyme related to lactoylglutathione lyase